MTRRHLILPLLSLLLPAAPISAIAQPLITLEEAVALALDNSPSIVVQSAAADEAAATARERRAGRLPSLTGSGSYQRLSSNVPDFSITFPALPGSPGGGEPLTLFPAILNRYNLQVSLQQQLFAGHAVSSAIETARYQAEAARAGVEAEEQAIVVRVHEAYWGLAQAQSAVAATASAVAAAEAHLDDVTRLREQGMATQADVLVVRARLAEIALHGIEAENAVKSARMALNSVLGRPLDRPIEAAALPDVSGPERGSETLVTRALNERAEVRAAQSGVRAAREALRGASAGRYPRVYLTANYRYARPNPFIVPPEDAFTGTWDAGIAASIDLWQWGRNSAREEQAEARIRQAQAHLDRVERGVSLEVERRLLDVTESLEMVVAAEQLVESAAEALRSMRDQFENGLVLSTALLDAEQVHLNAELTHQRALAAHAVARIRFAAASGEDLAP